jgi:hypothetical protein
VASSLTIPNVQSCLDEDGNYLWISGMQPKVEAFFMMVVR